MTVELAPASACATIRRQTAARFSPCERMRLLPHPEMQRARDWVKRAPPTKRKRATAPNPTGLDRNATKKVLQEWIISRGQDAMSNDKTSLSLESLDKVVGGTGGSAPDLDNSGKGINTITPISDEKK